MKTMIDPFPPPPPPPPSPPPPFIPDRQSERIYAPLNVFFNFLRVFIVLDDINQKKVW